MSNAAVAAKKPQPAKENPTLMPHRHYPAASKRNLWRVEAEQGITRQHIEEPGYWTHVAKKLAAGDLVEVFAEDGAFFAELLVRSAGQGGAKVHVLAWHDFSVKVPEGGFKIDWRQNKKHCVVRPDGVIVQDGFQTREDALKWLEENKAALTA